MLGIVHLHSTNAFQTSSTTVSGTIGDNGENEHRMMLDYETTDRRYDVIIAAAGSPSATLRSSVPTSAGDHSIIHRGVRTFTFGPSTSNASFYGALPSDIVITRPYYDSKEVYGGREYICYATGFTQDRGASKGGSATTRLILDDSSKTNRITQGMLVLANGVNPGTTVVEVRDKYITLSATATVAAGTDIQFITNSSNVKTFSFTITPNSNTLAVNTANSIASAFDLTLGVPARLSKTVDGAVGSGTTITLDDVDYLIEGISVSGTNISGGTTISSIDVTNKQITLSQSVGGAISDDATLTFTGGTGDGISLIYENVSKVGNNILVQGALSIQNIAHSVDANINVDNLISRS